MHGDGRRRAVDPGRRQKKELVERFKNACTSWSPKDEPEAVAGHDFVTERGRANPYGVYDLQADAGWVNAATDHDTASFAVQRIRRWWQLIDQVAYPPWIATPILSELMWSALRWPLCILSETIFIAN